MKRFLTTLALLAAGLSAVMTSLFAVSLLAGTAHASTLTIGQRVLAEAQTRTGDWYVYGAAGPTTFDCSGLVYFASHMVGVSGMPRTTYEMLGSRLLVRTYHPVAGDLAFYGSGHVEIVARGHDITFGAQQTGTQVGPHQWNSFWRPTMFFRIA